MIARAYLGIGSNIGGRRANLAGALGHLAAYGVSIGKVSSIYESQAQGRLLAQPDFLNAAVGVSFDGGLSELLTICLDIEDKMGRVRVCDQGPRLIDIDIILAGSVVSELAHLRIPHPGLTERLFVLIPLLELDQHLQDPRDGHSLSDDRKRLLGHQRIRRIETLEPWWI